MFRLLMILLLCSGMLYSKNIKDYFLMLPDIKNDYGILTLEAKKALLNKKSNHYQLDVLDLKNGYMKFHTKGDGAGVNTEITYYNLKKGKKLLIVNDIDWAMCCESSTLHFFQISGKKVVKLNQDQVLPDFDLIDFQKDSRKIYRIETKNDQYLVYSLPQKGKNITLEIDFSTFMGYGIETEDKTSLTDATAFHKNYKPVIFHFNKSKNGTFFLKRDPVIIARTYLNNMLHNDIDSVKKQVKMPFFFDKKEVITDQKKLEKVHREMGEKVAKVRDLLKITKIEIAKDKFHKLPGKVFGKNYIVVRIIFSIKGDQEALHVYLKKGKNGYKVIGIED